MMRTLVFIVATLALACGPIQPPRPLPSGDTYQDACNNMAHFGDDEGRAPDCAALLRRVDEQGMISTEAPCLAKAETRAQFEACYADDIE